MNEESCLILIQVIFWSALIHAINTDIPKSICQEKAMATISGKLCKNYVTAPA